ncbi:50S ribosomal protein L24 [Iodidimonas sp. SYSU 1G8]|uniref:50S ribosomal protein L24 n=1 Tax=Iodidimonas sp. SYSU 1G8 TaxID=3133967 RepID=UPI0031FE800D
MAAKIKKGDQVIVTKGRDKGKKGEVLRVIPTDNRAVVQGVNVVKKHKRPNQFDAGGIKSEEAPLALANLAIVDPKTGEPTRVGFKILEDGRKVRFAKKSGDVIDG